MDTSSSLLDRLRQPADHKAWERFVELYTPLLYYWARRTGLQDADAADLVQEVLVLLFRKLPEFRYDRHKGFRNWLRTVTLNKWRQIVRRRRPATLDGTNDEAQIPEAEASHGFEEAEYQRSLVQEALRALQGEFPATTWKAFQLLMAGRSASEVAAELGVRVGTVYAAKSRVLSRLRGELGGLLD